MYQYFKKFFNPPTLAYSYNKPRASVIAELNDIFQQKVSMFTNNDVTGKFKSENKFVLDVVSPAYTRGGKYSATLEAEIMEKEKDYTTIKTRVSPNPVWYLLFFLSIVFSLILFYNYISTGLIKFLFGSVAMLFCGPFISVALSNIGIGIIRERYYLYIHKKLKS